MNTEPSQTVNEKDKNVQTVTSIGNSWVVCKSKSHVGHIYYFNTLTGEAVWNLSDSEIEKAKKRTILQRQSGAIYEGCPEPKDPPNDYVNDAKKANSKQSCSFQPQQFMRNQFSSQRSQQSTLNAHCVNCPVNSINTLPAPSTYNPNIWAIPPNHQIVIAPTNQTPTSLSVAYNNLEQHVSIQDTPSPLPRGFNTFNRNRGNRNLKYGRGSNYVPRKNYVNQRQTDIFWSNKFSDPSSSNDLRQILSAKSQNRNKSYENQGKMANDTNTGNKQKIQIIKPAPEEPHPSDADDHWLKAHAYVEGTQLKLNVRSLKDIVMLDENMGCWYIVADANILLNHFNFINVVVSSDEECQLMVSDDTMAELQMTSRSDDIVLMSRAHLVLRLLSQQFITGHAVLGKDQSDDPGNKSMLDFTLKLAEQNHNVVLVSNNMESTKSNNDINIFTIEQMKEIIIKAKSKLQDLSQTSRIKIMVPNDTTSSDYQSLESMKNKTANEEQKKQKDGINREKNIFKSMGVQTENNLENYNPTFTGTFHSEGVTVNSKDDLCIEQTEQANNVENIDESKNTNHPPKRREIRLKRNIFNQSAVSNAGNPITENNAGKKQFKWRKRKKDVVETTMEDTQPTADVTDSCNDNAKQYADFSNDVVVENFYCNEMNENEITHKDPNEDNYSETTSGSCFVQRENCHKMVIEETSTSGIISNTPSIVESESLNSVNQNFSKDINNDTADQNSIKCVMFEVDNTVMEDNLKIRSDEWYSMFIQIMEEILTQILRLDPPFNHDSLPPPWTLHEATECIKRKFHTDCDITDSASKLADVLYRNSDKRGKITSPLKPSAFMEMYSYGVYLVDSLQAVITDCGDLQTAADSLAKLLTEIQNPNEYGTNNDSFNEEFDDPTPSASLCVSDNATEKESNSTCNHNKEDVSQLKQKSNINNQSSIKKYNLRSSQQSFEENIAVPETVSFIRNIDVESTFFSSLSLRKNIFNSDSISSKKNTEKDKKVEEEDNSISVEQNPTGPEIIRKFSKHTEFEERLKNKERADCFGSISYDYDEDEGADEVGEEVHEAELEEGEYEEGEYEEREYDYYDDEYDYYSEDIGDGSEFKNDIENEETIESEKGNICDFNLVVGKVIHELRQAFIEVHTFCANICNELRSSVPLNYARRFVIQEEAEAAKTHLNNLIKSLNSIIFREDFECGSSIQSILQESGVVLDSSQAVEYRKTIAKGKEQACLLLESVNIVLEAVK